METCEIVLLFTMLATVSSYSYSNNQSEFQRTSIFNNPHRTRRQIPQGVVKTVPDYIRDYGYPVEVHEVTTADGYILTMIRIPYGKYGNAPRRKPILLHHGLLSDSSSWILNDPDKLLVLQLADLGFDIWLANARGTKYSRKHKRFTDKDKAFFRYSIDDIGKYDVPAEINYILATTGVPKIMYAGHSMGGLVFHMAMCTFPELNNRISLMIGIDPAIYVKHLTGIVRLLLGFGHIIIDWIGVDLVSYGTGQFPNPFFTYILQLVGMSACSWRPITLTICTWVKNIIFGASLPNTNTYAKLLTTHPSSSSNTVIRHFIQLIKTGNFQHFDYGRSKNLKIYGTKKPPLYSLKYTTVPVAIFYAQTDALVPPKDIMRLASELPNNVYLHGTKPKANHLDFVVANDANEIFNKYAIALFLRY